MSEDLHAKAKVRQQLTANSRDLARNFVIASWCLRKHLDFVADFSFQAATDDKGYNQYLEAWHREQAKRENFDVANRHCQRRAVRLAEAGKMIDGDHWWLKLAGAPGSNFRGKRQAIEGDRIDMPGAGVPRNSKPEDWTNGCRVDGDTGRLLAVGVCRRKGKTKELQRIVSARNILQHAAYEFRVDQVRGISPITAALNWYRDLYEGFEFHLAKVKLSALFGLQITRQASGEGAFEYENEEDTDGDGVADAGPRIDLKQGPFVTELEPGEEVKTIEGKTPSAETVAFLELMMQIALKACDIPYSFFDESFSTFYGSRAGLINYLHSCNNKVVDLQEFQDEDFRWRAGLAIEDGSLELPSGKDFDFLKWEYIPGGVPWWDPAKEARGQAMAIAMGQSSPLRVCRETGTNFYRNIDETAEAMAYAAKKGVPLTFADSSAFAPEITIGADGENQNGGKQ